MIYLDEAIRFRHSVRLFLKKSVENSKIIEILDAARNAPSAKNRQPWRFIVLNQTQREKISDIMMSSESEQEKTGSTIVASAEIVCNAPAVIAVFSAEKPSTSTFISFGACLENMSLKAVELGLGSVIICDSQAAEKQITEYLNKSDSLIALFAVGYEKGNGVFREKRSLDSLVEGIEFPKQTALVSDDLPEADVSSQPFLFISYCHRDSSVVLADICELKKHGVRLWYDKSIYAGEVWDEKALSIIQQENCVGVIVYVSKDAVESEAVAKELTCAKERFKDEQGRIISVHIGDKPISAYFDGDKPLNEKFSCVIADNSKYIARKIIPSSMDAIEEIIDNALRLGAVSESGIYDEFRYREISEGVEITKYVGSSKFVAIPDYIAGKKVCSIGNSALRDNLFIEEVWVPETVNKVGEGAFFGMKNLRKISLPESLVYLGVASFRGCSSLTYVHLPANLKKLEEALFRECTALVECDVPSKVTEFGEAVFNNCISLVRVVARSVVKMTEGGFFNCNNLEIVELSPDIEGLEKESFATCPKVNVSYCGFHYHDGLAEKV